MFETSFNTLLKSSSQEFGESGQKALINLYNDKLMNCVKAMSNNEFASFRKVLQNNMLEISNLINYVKQMNCVPELICFDYDSLYQRCYNELRYCLTISEDEEKMDILIYYENLVSFIQDNLQQGVLVSKENFISFLKMSQSEELIDAKILIDLKSHLETIINNFAKKKGINENIFLSASDLGKIINGFSEKNSNILKFQIANIESYWEEIKELHLNKKYINQEYYKLRMGVRNLTSNATKFDYAFRKKI